MTSAYPSKQSIQAKQQARSVLRKQIVAPFLIGLIGIIVLTAIAVFAPRTDVTANVMMIVLMLCPAFICLFPLYILMVAGVYGLNRAQHNIEKPLAKATQVTADMRDKTISASATISRKTVNWSAKLAPIENAMKKAFDTPAWLHEKDDSEHDQRQK